LKIDSRNEIRRRPTRHSASPRSGASAPTPGRSATWRPCAVLVYGHPRDVVMDSRMFRGPSTALPSCTTPRSQVTPGRATRRVHERPRARVAHAARHLAAHWPRARTEPSRLTPVARARFQTEQATAAAPHYGAAAEQARPHHTCAGQPSLLPPQVHLHLHPPSFTTHCCRRRRTRPIGNFWNFVEGLCVNVLYGFGRNFKNP
jgi:hypothetical protein